MLRTFRNFCGLRVKLTQVLPRQRGFSLVSAMFLLIILALLGVAMMAISGAQHNSQALDVNGSRAYQAGEAGLEWGMMQVLDPSGTNANLSLATPQPPACFAATTVAMASVFSAFTTNVTCSVVTTTEGNRQIAVYTLTSTATSGAGSTAVERQVTATVSRCVDPSGPLPRRECQL